MEFYKRQEGNPNSDFLTDKHAIIVTNWSSFPYEAIAFDESAAIGLLLEKTPFTLGTGGFVRITFSGTGN